MRDENIQEFTEHHCPLDRQTTNLAIEALSKITSVRFMNTSKDIPSIYEKFLKVEFLHQ